MCSEALKLMLFMIDFGTQSLYGHSIYCGPGWSMSGEKGSNSWAKVWGPHLRILFRCCFAIFSWTCHVLSFLGNPLVPFLSTDSLPVFLPPGPPLQLDFPDAVGSSPVNGNFYHFYVYIPSPSPKRSSYLSLGLCCLSFTLKLLKKMLIEFSRKCLAIERKERGIHIYCARRGSRCFTDILTTTQCERTTACPEQQ